MSFDVVIVGGGPAGLAAAVRLRQLSRQSGREISVCLVEKGSQIGAHVLSGNVFDPRSLTKLLPNWRQLGAPLSAPVTQSRLFWLCKSKAYSLPVPPAMKNKGNYVISLGVLCRWLAEQAESLGAEIFAGFPAAELLSGENQQITGIATADRGRQKDGSFGPEFQPGIELRATYTLLAEGCRGSLARQAIDRFGLDAKSDPQTYGLGIKEIWEIDPERHAAGSVLHTVGWPLDRRTYGGAFLYHMEAGQVAVGLVTGLDYANPYLDPFEEMQRFKLHPAICPFFKGGRRVAYGARTLSEGGLQSLPRVSFPGGALLGDAAGLLDSPRIKGAHTAIESGRLAAEAVFEALESSAPPCEPESYGTKLENSWVWEHLHRSRNIRPAFRWGLLSGMAYGAFDNYLLRGRAPWTLRHRRPDRQATKVAAKCQPIDYPLPDGKLTFDRPSSVYLSGTSHREGEPRHLILTHKDKALSVNLERYAGLEARYCPAGVYVFSDGDEGPTLQIDAQNCLHCKACDIKDPSGNITWTVPEGGDGPNYSNM